MGILDDLEAAREDYVADVKTLDDLADDQVDYLSRLDEVEDPDTDGLECTHDIVTVEED